MLRRSSTRLRVAMSTSSMSTLPWVGSIMRLTMRSNVVLPQPDEPTKTVVVREGSSRLKSLTASVPSAKVLAMERYSIMRSSAHVGWASTVGSEQTLDSLT